MTDDLKDFIQDAGAVLRQVTFNGKTIGVYFKRISAKQKADLLKGQKVQATSGQKSTFEIDLAENARSKALLVLYSVAHENGNQYFQKIADVESIDAGKLEALYLAASDVNKDDFGGDDSGKS